MLTSGITAGSTFDMPWPTILIALCLASAFAGLVLQYGWQSWIALLTIVGGAVMFSLVLVLLVLCLADDRRAVWNSFATNFRSSVKQAFRYFRH